MDITIRAATEDDWPAISRQDGRSFGVQYSEQDLVDSRLIVDVRRFFVADEDGDIVGVTGDFPFEMTVPGGGSIRAAGVTWVSVAATHRRRGILTELMVAQHRWFVDQGYPVAILTASESSIYGRYGYGPASTLRRLEVDRRFADLRADLPESGRVRLVDAAEARALLPDLHERWRRQTPGGLSRSEPWWDVLFLDREHRRDGASGLFYAVHPDGYVSYRIDSNWQEGFPAHALLVNDMFTATPGANIDLWRFLLGIDLVGPIRSWDSPFGDPVPFLLDQPRAARTLLANDGMWVRVLDVAAALGARRYATAGSLVLDVRDPFLDRGGRFAVTEDGHESSSAPTSADADLVLDIATLGAIYLGDHRPSTLARAGLIDERRAGAVGRADVMFLADRPAHYGTSF